MSGVIGVIAMHLVEVEHKLGQERLNKKQSMMVHLVLVKQKKLDSVTLTNVLFIVKLMAGIIGVLVVHPVEEELRLEIQS